MPTARKHKKPAIPKEAKEAELVFKQFYTALTADGAPKATPTGYIMGVGMLMKALIDQAEKQGSNRQQLKAQAFAYLQII